MVPGLIGQIQALEVVKIVLGLGKEHVLSQRMVFFDALSMQFRNVKIRGKMKDCICCGETPSLTDVATIDYEEFCQTNCSLYAHIKLPPENSVPIEDFGKVVGQDKENIAVIDVRPAVHFGIVSLPQAINIPWKAMEKDPEQAKSICSDKEKVFIMCRRGNDSKLATEFLINECGVKNCINVEGGIEAYSKQVDKTLPTY